MTESFMQSFDPSTHLGYVPPQNKYSMDSLGLGGKGISDVGITEPFPLLSAEGVRALRGDVFRKDVLDNYSASIPSRVTLALVGFLLIQPLISFFPSSSTLNLEAVSSYLASCQVRGMAPEASKFVADLWSHPDTIKACSEAAGVELVPIMEYEVCPALCCRSRLSADTNQCLPSYYLGDGNIICSSATQTSKPPPAAPRAIP